MSRRRGAVRWRCLLCADTWWHTGTWADWQYHYTLIHAEDADGH